MCSSVGLTAHKKNPGAAIGCVNFRRNLKVFFLVLRSLETECRRAIELQKLLSAAQRTSDEQVSSADQKPPVAELRTQLNEQVRRTNQLQAVLDDESRKLTADKVRAEVTVLQSIDDGTIYFMKK